MWQVIQNILSPWQGVKNKLQVRKEEKKKEWSDQKEIEKKAQEIKFSV